MLKCCVCIFVALAVVANIAGQTFLPGSASALVQSGGEVEVRLSVTEQRGGQVVASGRELEFVVIGSPRAGEVVELRQTPRSGARDAAILRYRHWGGREVARDVIRYIVIEKDTGVEVTSGSVLIQIAISRLEVEGGGVVNFGNVALGNTAEAVVVLRNTGTEVAAGSVLVDSPFLVGGQERYVVPQGDTRRITLGFRPEQVGAVSAVVRFSENPEAQVEVRGTGVGSLTVLGADFFWLAVEGRKKRLEERSFELRVASGSGVQVEIDGGEFLKAVPGSFFLGSGPARRIVVSGGVPAAGSYRGELLIKAGFESARIPWAVEVWREAALLPVIRRVSFSTRMESRDIREVEFCNEGEMPWFGNFLTESPFEVISAPQVVLPGAGAVVRVALRGVDAGRVSGNLTWSGAAGRTVVLAGNVASSALTAQSSERVTQAGAGNFFLEGNVARRVELPEGGGFLMEGNEVYVVPAERLFRRVRWRQVDPSRVVLEWEVGEVKDVPDLEIRLLRLVQQEDMRVVMRWVRLEDVLVRRDPEGNFSAQISELVPRVGYSFSIWSKEGIGTEAFPMSESVNVRTFGRVAEESSEVMLWLALFGVLAVGGVWVLILKKRGAKNKSYWS